MIPKLLLAILLLCFGASARGSTSLEQSLELSVEVKKFEAQLGIKPMAILSKAWSESSPVYFVWIWIQRKGVFSSDFVFHGKKILKGISETEILAGRAYIQDIRTRYPERDFDMFVREGEIAASTEVTITQNFILRPLVLQALTIFHEDLHFNIHLGHRGIEESVVTALGYFATIEFFKSRNDHAALAEIRSQMERRCRASSQDLLRFVKQAQSLFQSLPLEEARAHARELLPSYPAYASYFNEAGQNTFEARVSHDLMYLGYCERLARLYEKIGFKTLFQNILTVPVSVTPKEFEARLLQMEK